MELKTDSGITGIGVGSPCLTPLIEQLVNQILLGEDPRRVTGLWQRMVEGRFHGSHGGLVNGAISVLDIALWDLKAKANNEPLWKCLGGTRPRGNAYASDNGLPLSDAELKGWYCSMARDFGIGAGKLKVGWDQTADMERLGLMREALKETLAEPVLMIDADESYSPKQAIRKVREMEEAFDLTWVEAPARCWDFMGMKRISGAIRAAVCNSELLGARKDFLPLFHHHAADIIQLNIGECGITGALQLADAAYGLELPVTLAAAPGNIHAHLAPVMPYFMNLEVIDPVAPESFLTSAVRIEGGVAVAGESPGNGLVIDNGALAGMETGACPVDFYERRRGAGLDEILPGEAMPSMASRELEE